MSMLESRWRSFRGGPAGGGASGARGLGLRAAWMAAWPTTRLLMKISSPFLANTLA